MRLPSQPRLSVPPVCTCSSSPCRPARKAKAHTHESHETAIYVLSGESGIWYGDRLQHHVTARAGEFLYMPPGVPHLPYNLSQSEPVTAVIARTDPNDQESVILLPELDAIHAWAQDRQKRSPGERAWAQ